MINNLRALHEGDVSFLQLLLLLIVQQLTATLLDVLRFGAELRHEKTRRGCYVPARYFRFNEADFMFESLRTDGYGRTNTQGDGGMGKGNLMPVPRQIGDEPGVLLGGVKLRGFVKRNPCSTDNAVVVSHVVDIFHAHTNASSDGAR